MGCAEGLDDPHHDLHLSGGDRSVHWRERRTALLHQHAWREVGIVLLTLVRSADGHHLWYWHCSILGCPNAYPHWFCSQAVCFQNVIKVFWNVTSSECELSRIFDFFQVRMDSIGSRGSRGRQREVSMDSKLIHHAHGDPPWCLQVFPLLIIISYSSPDHFLVQSNPDPVSSQTQSVSRPGQFPGSQPKSIPDPVNPQTPVNSRPVNSQPQSIICDALWGVCTQRISDDYFRII